MKEEKNISTSSRDRVSQNEMPRFALSEALLLAKALKDNFASKGSTPINLAQAIKRSPSSSAWRILTGAAMAYGITDGGYNASEISLTNLGDKIVNPTEEGEDTAAMLEAVLRPTVLKKFYEKYDGQKLPKEDIGKNVLHQLGVPAERTKEAWEIVIENAKLLEILTDVNGSQYVQLWTSKSELGKSPASLLREEEHKPAIPSPSSNFNNNPGASAVFQDSGAGWTVTIRSRKPISSEAKKKLIEVSELLDKANADNSG